MYIVCIDVYKGGGIFKKTLRKPQKEKYMYVYIYTHSSIRYSYTHPVKRKTLQIMLWMSHKTKKVTSFSSGNSRPGVHLIRVQKKGEGSRGFTVCACYQKSKSTGRLQFLNSTPQRDEWRTLAAVLLGLLEDR